MAKKPVTSSAKKPQTQAKPAPQGANDNNNWRALGLLVLALAAACYFPTLKHDFVNWDDPSNITENPNLEMVGQGQPWGVTISSIFDLEKGNVIGNYNPLPILTFAIEKSLAGGVFSPKLTHAVNLLLHLLTVFFVMRLLAGMGLGRWGVAFGGLLFALHPMRVESVAWATERKDVLFAVFFFAALVYYVKWLKQGERGESRNGTYAMMLVLALLSCFSKVQAVTLPLSMLALDYWFRRPLNFKLILEKAPFWVLSLIFGLINVYTLRSQGSMDDTATAYSFLDRLCVGAYSLSTYVYKVLLPVPMSPLYAYPKQLPMTVYLSPLLFLVMAGGFWWLWKKGLRAWVFGVAFFFFNVMFLLQIFAAGQGFLADRFTYVAYFGLFAIAAYYADLYAKEEKSRQYVMILFGVAALVYSIWTVRQIGIWKDGYALWTHVMSLDEGSSEKSSLPYWNRGQYLREQRRDFEAALKDYTAAVEMDVENPELLNSRGKTYFDMAGSGKYQGQEKTLLDKAIKDYSAALSKPKITFKSKSEALSNRGASYGMLGQYNQSAVDLSEAIKLDPNNKNAYANRSIVYFNLGQLENALADYQAYLKFEPNNANFWYESGMVQRVLKKNEGAVQSLDRAIQLKPTFGLAYLERARAKMQAGNRAGAELDYQQADKLGAKRQALDDQLQNAAQ